MNGPGSKSILFCEGGGGQSDPPQLYVYIYPSQQFKQKGSYDILTILSIF